MQRAIEARLYYPALLVALTLPEICSALALDRQVFVKQKHYVDFVDKYSPLPGPEGSTEPFLGLSGLDCYRLRGGVVHRASFIGSPHFDATHVVFTVPETGSSIHALSVVAGANGEKVAACFDLIEFCKAMDLAARRWFQDHKSDPKVAENLANVIRWAPEGVSPFLRGGPVVASGQ
jgi:hypothetical protein